MPPPPPISSLNSFKVKGCIFEFYWGKLESLVYFFIWVNLHLPCTILLVVLASKSCATCALNTPWAFTTGSRTCTYFTTPWFTTTNNSVKSEANVHPHFRATLSCAQGSGLIVIPGTLRYYRTRNVVIRTIEW